MWTVHGKKQFWKISVGNRYLRQHLLKDSSVIKFMVLMVLQCYISYWLIWQSFFFFSGQNTYYCRGKYYSQSAWKDINAFICMYAIATPSILLIKSQSFARSYFSWLIIVNYKFSHMEQLFHVQESPCHNYYYSLVRSLTFNWDFW